MNLNRQTFDVIVVGSGPGGATVARDMAKAGKKVLILERGSNAKLKGAFWQYLLYQCVPFQSLLFNSQLVGMVRGLITGGSSIFYYGTCFPVPFDMLESYGVDIRQEVAEIREELPIAPLSDDIMGPKAKRIMQSARELGYAWNKLDKFMDQAHFDPNQHPAHYFYGDPRKVKWSARMYVEQALEYGAVLKNHAKVKQVIIEEGKAKGVTFTCWGRKQTVFASKIVIAAGGIGSPMILKQSGISKAGCDFFFDPLISVVGYIDGIENKAEIPMSGGALIEDEGYVMTDMAIPKMLDMAFTLSALRFHRIFSQKKAVRIMVKVKDDLGGRIGSWGGIRKRLTQADKEKLNSGYRRAKEILKNAGAKEVFKTWTLAAHPGGTVKIGELVDADLKTQFDNLYVCDCSVIPKAWGLPPTLTILGLARKLSKHLLGQTQSTSAVQAEPRSNQATAKGVSDIVVKALETKEGRVFVSQVVPDILNIWAGRNMAKQAILKPVGQIIGNGFAGTKSLDSALRLSVLFRNDAFLDLLGRELPGLVDGALNIVRQMVHHLESLPVEGRKAYLLGVFRGQSQGATGEILTSLSKMVQAIHQENPLFFSDLLGPWVKNWMEKTDFGELKDAFAGATDDMATLVESIMETLINYPSKLVVSLSLLPDIGDLLLKSVQKIFKALNLLSPDLLTDVVLSLVREVNGASVGDLINELSELIRKLHTGSALLGEPNNPQFPRDLRRFFDQISESLDTALVLKSGVMLAELVETAKEVFGDTLNRNPELQSALFRSGFTSVNARTRALAQKAQVWEAMLDEGRFAREASEGIKEIDSGELADAVNRICTVLNQARKEEPRVIRASLRQFVETLDIDEIGQTARWVVQDAVTALKPAAKDILPPLLKGLAELLKSDDENGEELEEALAELRQTLWMAEETV